MKIACIQTTSTASIDENIESITPMIEQAAAAGASLIALPENAFLMASGRVFHEQVYMQQEHPAVIAMQKLAKRLGVSLLIGSVAVKDKALSTGKYANRQVLISKEGEVITVYDKIHLFDVSIPQGESHQESRRFVYGEKAVIAEVEGAKLGMSICYDVRFPHLYRALAKAGAELLAIPAAFTRFTGEKGGWHVLCRARAMETGCFVIAPAQCGTHSGDRQTYGHSLIINPWGEILTEGGDKPGIFSAEIDLAEVAKTRQVMPSLNHDREFVL